MAPRICVVIADHRHDESLTDLVRSIRAFAPAVEIALYNTGEAHSLQQHPAAREAAVLPSSRPLEYAKVTPFFLDMFEWAAGERYDFIVNAETDMAWIKPGFDEFIFAAMKGFAYMAPNFARGTPRTSRWRPYHSLRPELPELLDILGVSATNQCFSPGQIFSSRYIDSVTSSRIYPELRSFVARNQGPGRSFSLQEVLLPTLADVFSLAATDYPGHLKSVNRYRPYHAAPSVERAATTPGAYFVHPIRRDSGDPARLVVRNLLAGRQPAEVST
jgi:hypothetical protein